MSTTDNKPEVRHPEVHVQLTGTDGNIFFIIGRVRESMFRAGVPSAELDEFCASVMGTEDYDHALRCVMSWVSVS